MRCPCTQTVVSSRRTRRSSAIIAYVQHIYTVRRRPNDNVVFFSGVYTHDVNVYNVYQLAISLGCRIIAIFIIGSRINYVGASLHG